MFLLIKQRWKKTGFTFILCKEKVGHGLNAKELCVKGQCTSSSTRRVMISGHLSAKQWGLIFVRKRFSGQKKFPKVRRDWIHTDPQCSLGDKRPSLIWYWAQYHWIRNWKLVWWSRSMATAKWETLGLLLSSPTTSIPSENTTAVHLTWACIE